MRKVLNDNSLKNVTGGVSENTQEFYVGQVLKFLGFSNACKVTRIRTSGNVHVAFFRNQGNGWIFVGEDKVAPSELADTMDVTNDPEFEYIKNYQI